ncbi:MAG: hypothetical protein ACFE8M_01030 [Candidatus Hermodarchaeota archaeon]
MFRRKKICLLAIGLIFLIILISNIHYNSENSKINEENITPKLSTSLEGVENILITDMIRTVNISGYDLVNFKDKLTILNQNNNPITSIFFPIHLNKSNDVIFCKATGESKNTLLTERNYLVLNDYELIAIYFDSPLLPHQKTTISFYHSLTNCLIYYTELTAEYQLEQYINITESIFPILPYKAEGGEIQTNFILPKTSNVIWFDTVEDLGFPIIETHIVYDLTQTLYFDRVDPFLANFNKSQQEVLITFQDNRFTKMEFEKVNREINISPWGIIKVKENYIFQNLGAIDISTFPLHIPYSSKNVHVYDDIGNIGEDVVLDDSEAFSNKKSFIINLAQNRVPLKPLSKISFTVEYFLDISDYNSINWFQESIQINLFTTTFDWVSREQTINVVVQGCNNLEYVSLPPDAIIDSGGSKTLVYNFNIVTSIESKMIQFTFSIDLFELLLRPILISLIIGLLASIYVIVIKIKKEREEKFVTEKVEIPVDELREYCSLSEEKNALVLEIRRAEEDAKRKKIAKKVYSNLLSKNTTKIEQIKQELLPFKKVLIETSETFENTIKKLDVLDAERESVNDSLTLLDNRYKRGKLPSKAAYQKLLEDFMKRRRRIDRTIDKNIQQLRSYLL